MELIEVSQHDKMWLNKKGGIYLIYNKANNHGYIGSAKDFHERMTIHLSRLRSRKKASLKLQTAFDEFKEESFEFIVLEYAESEQALDEREREWVSRMKPEYNHQKVTRRHTFSAERNAKISRHLQENIKRGPDSPNYGKERSREIIDRIFETRKKLDKNELYKKSPKAHFDV